MQEIIEKLLILQDRDRKIHRVSEELAQIAPERTTLQTKAAATQHALEAAKTHVKQLDAKRKQLDLEIEAKKSQIEKYANQQLQTRKNEEYRALAHEIEMAKEAIFKIEDQEIVVMEQSEAGAKDVVRASGEAAAAKKRVEDEIGLLNQREANLKKELDELSKGRTQLAGAVDDATRNKYERLVKSKGENVVVGVEHSACGGCHMKLPAQVVTTARGAQELVTCPNCGRILYFTRDMILTAAD